MFLWSPLGGCWSQILFAGQILLLMLNQQWQSTEGITPCPNWSETPVKSPCWYC